MVGTFVGHSHAIAVSYTSMVEIKIPGLRVVDFAYTPRSSATLLPPVPEIFDQQIGIAEVEYCWSQNNRFYPISGKILSRLLDLEWISEDEICARGSAMDLVELQKHKTRQTHYPWRPVHTVFTRPPTPKERQALLTIHLSSFQHQDFIRLKWASRKRANIASIATECPKQYPAPLHAYNRKSYPELGPQAIDIDGEREEDSHHGKRRKLSRTETVLL